MICADRYHGQRLARFILRHLPLLPHANSCGTKYERLNTCRSPKLGLQQQKRIRWTDTELVELLDKRIAWLVRDQYTTHVPGHRDLMPQHLGKQKREPTIQFVLNRTWHRPRDVIEFFNACIRRAEGRAIFSRDIILDAEGEYSRGRLRALAQEWFKEYPHLPECAKQFLTNRSPSFQLGDIDAEELVEWALSISCARPRHVGRLSEAANECIESGGTPEAIGTLRRQLASAFYRTGIVGLRTQAGAGGLG